MKIAIIGAGNVGKTLAGSSRAALTGEAVRPSSREAGAVRQPPARG